MRIFTRSLLALCLLLGGGTVEATNNSTFSQLDLYSRRALVEGDVLRGLFRGCKELSDLREWLRKSTEEEAEHFFFWKRKVDQRCAALQGVIEIRDVVGPEKAGDGNLYCIFQISLHSVWDAKELRFCTAWVITDKKSADTCRVDPSK